MSRIGRIARRTFLVGSVAVAGGVAFGVYQIRKPLENPLSPEDGEAVLNPWVVLDSGGVTIVAPRAEMGQGVHTTLAALAAEELDVPWESVRVIHGPAAEAYFNGGMMAAAVPAPHYKHGFLIDLARDAMPAVGKLMGVQMTGGSTSMIDGFEKMRAAGAAARHVIIQAAAKRLGAAPGALSTQDGFVVGPGSVRVAYTDLVEEARGIEAPKNPELRSPRRWRHLGTTMPRVDMVGKVTGTAEYGLDVRLEGMLFASVKASPVFGGRLLDMDTFEARAIPGVRKILRLPDAVAAVADDTWTAMRAVDTVEVVWEAPTYPETSAEIMDAIAASFDGEPDQVDRDDGDVDALRVGPTAVEAEYRLPYLAHACMEPMNATALFVDGRLTVWTGNQAPTVLRDRCAETAGIESSAVEIVTPYMGGGFGRRAEPDVAVQATRVAIEMPGTPIQLVWSREEDTRHDTYRPATIGRARGEVKDGELVSLAIDVAAPSVFHQSAPRIFGFTPPGPDATTTEGSANQPYRIENYRVRAFHPEIPVPIGFWRSVGNTQNAVYHECFIDELAEAAGRDPIEFRLGMMRDEHEPSALLLERVRAMSGWTGSTPEGVGRGVAFCHSFGTGCAQVVQVRRTDRGVRITDVWCAADPGLVLDPGNAEAQLMSGIVYGLSAAMTGEITLSEGRVEQSNFHDYEVMRIDQTPAIHIALQSNQEHMGGLGEPGTPPSTPALMNALHDLDGERHRELPLSKRVTFA